MKKRVEKPRAKPVKNQKGTARKVQPRAAGPHDPLHALLRGTYACRACERRG